MRHLIPVLILALVPPLCAALEPDVAHAQDRRLVHEVPAELPAGVAWECVVHVTRPGEWDDVSLFYRKGGEEAYTLLPFREDRGAFRATVPGDAIAPPALEYHIVARTTSGALASFPEETPREHPVHVTVGAVPIAGEAPPPEGILVLSPAPAEIAETATPDIAVLFDPPLAEASGAALFVDGADVTAASERTVDFLFFTPAAPLAPGEHEATIVARADSASPERRLSWRFHVQRGPAGAGAPAAQRAGEGFAYGRWEAGWAYARAEGDPEPFVLPYDETSDVTFYGSFDGARGTTTLHADASRDPIYDDEVRASARLDRGGLRAEAGDIYPYFSELSVAWQSGKGGLAAYEGRRAGAALFGMRTLDAEVFEGFGTYSQFLYGAQATGRAGDTRAALTLLFGHDREESIPDSTRFTAPEANRVASLLVVHRISPHIELGAEVAHASISVDGTETANGARVVALLGERGVNEIELEYHDYGRGFVSLGSPTIDSGERGVVIDGTARLPARLRATAEAEIYTDRDIFQPLEEGSPIVQTTARLDREFARSDATLSTYLFMRYYRVPFASIPYENRYATLGLFAQSGRAAGSLSATHSITESAVFDTSLFTDDSTFTGASSVSGSGRDWTLSGTASYSGLWGCVTPRAGLRWTHADPALGADEDRWTANADVSITLWRTTLSADYERIEGRTEGGGDDDFVEHVLTTTIGRTF